MKCSGNYFRSMLGGDGSQVGVVYKQCAVFGLWPVPNGLFSFHAWHKQAITDRAYSNMQHCRFGLKKSCLSNNYFGLHGSVLTRSTGMIFFCYLCLLTNFIDHENTINVRQVFNDMHVKQPVMIHPVGCACICYWWHESDAMADGGREEMSREPI